MKQDTKNQIILLLTLVLLGIFFWTAALNITPPPSNAGKDVWAHYHHGAGMMKALLTYLAIAMSIGSVVSFSFLLLARISNKEEPCHSESV